VGEAVEAQGAGKRNDMAAVDEPPAEPPLRLAELIEMHLGRILVESGRHLVLGLLDGDAVGMVDSFAWSVVLEAIRRTADGVVERRAVDARTGRAEIDDRDGLGKLGNLRRRRLGGGIALSHHHPANILDDRLAALIEAARAHMDDAALLVRVFLE